MINKNYLKFLIIVLTTNLLIFVINQPVSFSKNNNSICQSLERCVLLYDQPLFEIKEKTRKLTPEQRAYIISKRIMSQAKDMSINTDSFYVTQIDNSRMAAIASNSTDKNPSYLVTITQADAKAAKVKSPRKLATEYNTIIQKAINNYRNSIRGSSWITFSLLAVSFVILIHQFFWNLPVFFWNSLISNIKHFWNFPIFFWNSLISNIKHLVRWYNRKKQSKENTNQNSNQGSSSDTNDTQIKKKKCGQTKKKKYEQIKKKKYEQIKKKKYEQIKKQYRKGNNDTDGTTIEHIYCLDPDYVIYRNQNRIRCFINEDHLEDKKLTKNYDNIQKYISLIYSKQPTKIESIETINILIAHGIRLALGDKLDEAKEVLALANSRLDRFIKKDNVIKYFQGSLLELCSFLIAIPSLVIFPMLWPNSVRDILVLLEIPREFPIVMVFGALGGFLSVAYRITTVGIDQDPDSNFRILGASRIFIAVISSLVIYLALTGEIINVSFLSGNGAEISVSRIGFISAAAGFVERFVPDLLTHSTQQNKEPQNK